MNSFRSTNLLTVTAMVITFLAISSPGFSQRCAEARAGTGRGLGGGGYNALFDQIEKTPLSAAEIEGLTLMREEEKLARDVYTTLSDTWQLPIFGNIAMAEQRHIDALQMVFATYESEIDDRTFDYTVGVFANGELAELYLQLVKRGKSSLVDALTVGATIEDLDLEDLEDLLARTENDHIRVVYNNLAKGSRNHLRSFIRVLTAQGGSYSPGYLDQATFDTIVNSEMERRMVYGADGEVLATGGRGRSGQGRGGRGRGHGYAHGARKGSGPQGEGQTGGTNIQ
jgi:hypothetical protein